jgi:hypothetical protein
VVHEQQTPVITHPIVHMAPIPSHPLQYDQYGMPILSGAAASQQQAYRVQQQPMPLRSPPVYDHAPVAGAQLAAPVPVPGSIVNAYASSPLQSLSVIPEDMMNGSVTSPTSNGAHHLPPQSQRNFMTDSVQARIAQAEAMTVAEQPAAAAATVGEMGGNVSVMPFGLSASARSSGSGASFPSSIDTNSNNNSFSIGSGLPLASASRKAPCSRLVLGRKCLLLKDPNHMVKFNHTICPIYEEEGSCTEGLGDPEHDSLYVHPNPGQASLTSPLSASLLSPSPLAAAGTGHGAPAAAGSSLPSSPVGAPSAASVVTPPPQAATPVPIASIPVAAPAPVIVASVVPTVAFPPNDPFSGDGVVINAPAPVGTVTQAPPPLPQTRPPPVPSSRPPPLPVVSTGLNAIPPQLTAPLASVEACPFGHECRLLHKSEHVARWHQAGAQAKLSFGKSRLSDSIRAAIGDKPLPLVCPYGELCPLLRAGHQLHCKEMRHPW